MNCESSVPVPGGYQEENCRLDLLSAIWWWEGVEGVRTLNPASITPRRKRRARSCCVVFTAAKQAATVPQRNMRRGM